MQSECELNVKRARGLKVALERCRNASSSANEAQSAAIYLNMAHDLWVKISEHIIRDHAKANAFTHLDKVKSDLRAGFRMMWQLGSADEQAGTINITVLQLILDGNDCAIPFGPTNDDAVFYNRLVWLLTCTMLPEQSLRGSDMNASILTLLDSFHQAEVLRASRFTPSNEDLVYSAGGKEWGLWGLPGLNLSSRIKQFLLRELEYRAPQRPDPDADNKEAIPSNDNQNTHHEVPDDVKYPNDHSEAVNSPNPNPEHVWETEGGKPRKDQA